MKTVNQPIKQGKKHFHGQRKNTPKVNPAIEAYKAINNKLKEFMNMRAILCSQVSDLQITLNNLPKEARLDRAATEQMISNYTRDIKRIEREILDIKNKLKM